MNYFLKMMFFLFVLTLVSCTKKNKKKNTANLKLNITEVIYEGKPHFVIKTKSITWYFDKQGGGFSRMIDNEGNDWISFSREPWDEYPASSASSFRGIPNLVFKGDDGGAGHPGHEKCNSEIDGNKILTTSNSGLWTWTWEFFDDYAQFEILNADPNQAYWFLYEGTPGGNYDPKNMYFGASKIESTNKLPDFYKGSNLFDNVRWIYCGNQKSKNTFYMVQMMPDEKTDIIGFLGNTADGINSPDGMTVFGFGRDKNGNPLLTGNQKFVVGLYPKKLIKSKNQRACHTYLETNFPIE